MIDLANHWQSSVRVPDRRPIYTWASEQIRMPPDFPVQGLFDPTISPQFLAPFDALQANQVREVNVRANVRGGKTLIADVFAQWAVVNNHASVLRIMQKDEMAKGHAEKRMWPMLESSPEVRAILPRNKDKQRLQDCIFENGLSMVIRGPSLSNLQSVGYKVVIADELWEWAQGVLGHAKARLGDYIKMHASKFLGISQGGVEESDWEHQYSSGHEYVWRVPCAGCGKHFSPVWIGTREDGTRFGAVYDSDQNARGRYDKDRAASTIRYVCEHCGHEHPNTARTRKLWSEGAHYADAAGVIVGPGHAWPERCSFNWNALIDWPWDALVRIWIDAREKAHLGDYEATIQFFQKYMAQAKSEQSVHEGQHQFAHVSEPIDPKGKAWPEEHMRFLTADRQTEDTYWVTVQGWAKGDAVDKVETRVLWFGRLFSESDIEAKRIEWNVLPSATVVDSGYRPRGDVGVYAACIRYGWIAVKGEDDPYFWHIIKSKIPGKPGRRVQRAWAPLVYADPEEGTSGQGKRECPLYRFSSTTCKNRVQALIERGMWVIHDRAFESVEMQAEYKRQMSAEFKRYKYNPKKRQYVEEWECPSKNNHAFDCSSMQVFCAMAAGLLPGDIESADKPAEKEESKE